MKNFAEFCVLIAIGAMTILTTFVSSQNSTAEIISPQTTRILQPPSGARFVPDEVLVQFKSSTSATERSDAKRLVGVVQEKRLETEPMRAAGLGELDLISIGSGLTVEDAIRALENHPAVQFAEPNWIYNHFDTSNDPFYTNGSLWGMYGDLTIFPNQFGSQAGEAWANGFIGSHTVYVGVIDQGIQFDHPDLFANIWTNSFDPIDGSDNDGNGYVDDIHGWDFYNNDNTIYDGGAGGTQDRHGTHVAGTIGAVGGNGIGVVGVNWNVRMISGKFLGPPGGTTAAAILAVDYFTDLKTRHNLNVVATNNSWGGGGFSQALLDAITRAANANILFMAAAGNGGSDFIGDNNDTTPNYPSNYNTTAGAGYDNVIAVASITSSGARSSFSNFGATTVDLGAPGSNINSTFPFNAYGLNSGTSMATPHVTGAAALYKSINPGSSALTIRNAIFSSAIATPSLSGITVTGARLNIGDFTGGSNYTLTASPTTVDPGQTINVSWTAPAGRPANDWIGLYRVGDPDLSFISWQYTGGASSGSLPFSAPGQAGQYEFRYFTNDTFNRVATSNTVTVTGVAPTFSLSASPTTVDPVQIINVSWTAPAGRPAIDWIGLYRVGDPDTSYLSWQYTGGASSGSLPFSAPGQAGQYEFRYFTNDTFNRVATSNSVTVSAAFSLTASPSTVSPGQTINVSWTAPAGQSATDWIGLYRVGDPDSNYISWQYTGGAPSGSRQFTAPAQAGQYEFRYFTNDTFNRVATSNAVSVTGG